MLPIQENVSAAVTPGSHVEWQQGDFTLTCTELLFIDLPEDNNERYKPSVHDVEGCVVISQTCDVVRGSDILPNVTVCPLIKVNKHRISEVEKGKTSRYEFVGNLPDDMAVDFSRTMSVSKGLLGTWKRHRGCLDQMQSDNFARSLERFFGRFAFPDAFIESLRSFRNAVYGKYAKNSGLGEVLQSIREIRVRPNPGWNGKNDIAITFILILDEEAKRKVQDFKIIKKEIDKELTKITWHHPFSLHKKGLQLTTLASMTAGEYINSHLLDESSISFARRFHSGS